MYHQLFSQDKNVSDKIEIVKAAWCGDVGHWPNKHQELVNWLSFAVGKKFSQNESKLVWGCFHDVLKDLCQNIPANTYKLHFKPSVHQLLVKELSAVSGSTDHCETVVSSCHKFLTSKVFGDAFPYKLDFLMQILQPAVQLLVKQLTYEDNVSSCLLQLIQTAAEKYTAGCKRSPNVQQVITSVSQKLLLPYSVLHNIAGIKWGSKEEVSQTLHVLDTTIITALYPRELGVNYEVYLRLQATEDDKKSSPPKYIHSYFSQIQTALQSGKPQDYDAIVRVLPFLYRNFIISYIDKHRLMCFQYCQYICEMLHTLPCKAGTTWDTKCALDTRRQLVGMELVLGLVVEMDVYNMATDHIHGDKQLSWLQRCSQYVYAINTKAQWCSTFTLQRHLLELNYTTIETNIQVFLEKSWLDTAQIEEDSRPSQELLLCQLIQLYTKLRQLPKFITKLLEFSLNVSPKKRIFFPTGLRKCLAASLISQPVSVILSIWEKLVEHITHRYITVEGNAAVLHLLCQLLVTVTVNLSVDQAVSAQNAPKIMQLLDKMADIIPTLANRSGKKLSQVREVVLWLMYSWGEVQLVMSQYNQLATDTQLATDPAGDKQLLHGYITRDSWNKMEKSAAKDPSCTLIWVKLQHQLVRKRLCEADGDPGLVVDILADSIHHLSQDDPDITWDQQDLTERTLSVAVWSAICEVLPLVVGYVSDDQRRKLADHMTWTLTDTGNRRGITVYSVTKSLLDSGALWEMAALLDLILRNTWTNIATLITGDVTHSPKKKKVPTATLR